MVSLKSRGQVVSICIGLFCLTWLVFGQTIRFDFLNYDDDAYVNANAIVSRGLTASGFVQAFTMIHSNNWHPLTTLSHMVDCQLFGLNPHWHHFINVLLHSVAAVMLFLVCRSMTGWLWRSAFIAAVFAIHPLRAESVAWISERKDILSAAFFMATLAAYIRYSRKPSINRYLLTALVFVFGLLAKPMLVTAPIVLLLIDYWPLNRFKPGLLSNKNLFLEKLPLLALSAADSAMTLWAQKPAVVRADHVPLFTRLANALASYVIYIWQMIWPENLAAFYPYPESGPPRWQVITAGVIMVAISATAILLRRRWPYLLTGWLWYLIMLVPVIGFVQVGDQSHADRYTYLSEIGLYLAVAGIAGDVFVSPLQRRVLAGVAGIAVLLLAWCCAVQVSFWRNSELLWRRVITVSGDFHGYHGLGLVYLGEGRLPDAIQAFETALKLKPNDPTDQFNLAVALERSGKPEEAIPHLAEAVAARPNYPEAYCRLGNDLFATGQPTEAIQQYQNALVQRSHYPEVHYNLGMVLMQQGDIDSAQLEYERAIKDNPNYAEAYYGLGNLLFQNGRVDDAITKYRQALRARPDYVEVENNLASAFLVEGKTRAAIEQWETTLTRHDSSIEVMNNLAWVLATYPDDTLRNGPRAVELSDRAERLSDSSNAGVLRTLAAAYAEVGRFDRAIEVAERARDLARDQQNFDLVLALRDELALYQSNKPVRVAPPPKN